MPRENILQIGTHLPIIGKKNYNQALSPTLRLACWIRDAWVMPSRGASIGRRSLSLGGMFAPGTFFQGLSYNAKVHHLYNTLSALISTQSVNYHQLYALTKQLKSHYATGSSNSRTQTRQNDCPYFVGYSTTMQMQPQTCPPMNTVSETR